MISFSQDQPAFPCGCVLHLLTSKKVSNSAAFEGHCSHLHSHALAQEYQLLIAAVMLLLIYSSLLNQNQMSLALFCFAVFVLAGLW